MISYAYTFTHSLASADCLLSCASTAHPHHPGVSEPLGAAVRVRYRGHRLHHAGPPHRARPPGHHLLLHTEVLQSGLQVGPTLGKQATFQFIHQSASLPLNHSIPYYTHMPI